MQVHKHTSQRHSSWSVSLWRIWTGRTRLQVTSGRQDFISWFFCAKKKFKTENSAGNNSPSSDPVQSHFEIVWLMLHVSPGQTDSQVATSQTCIETCIGWPNRHASFLKRTGKSQNNYFKSTGLVLWGQYPLFYLLTDCYNNKWMPLNLQEIGWVVKWWLENFTLTCVYISTKVSASHRKCTQGACKYTLARPSLA